MGNNHDEIMETLLEFEIPKRGKDHGMARGLAAAQANSF